MNKEAFSRIDKGWFDKLSPFLLSGEFDEIIDKLREEGKISDIYPPPNMFLKSFEVHKYDNLKAVIVLQDPYNQPDVADGIPMSCSRTKVLQPSLKLFYDAINETVYNNEISESDYDPDLSYLLDQGVLLVNTALTVRKHEPKSHQSIWEPFTRYLFCTIDSFNPGIPLLLVGNDAKEIQKYLTPMRHWILEVEHPAFAARQKRGWNCKNAFNWINSIIKATNGVDHTIKWFK